jgi:hypothetical protein
MKHTQRPATYHAPRLLHRAHPVRCAHRGGLWMSSRRRTVVDDSGSLAITAWTCADCGELIEEIRILSRDGRPGLRPIRYAVAGQHDHAGGGVVM